jgi:holliday junction DNA helicase RuvA
MIEFLSGRMVEKAPTHVVLDCNGVGYLVNISLFTFEQLPKDENCKLIIHYAVSVDVRSGASNHVLYGFTSAIERTFFRLLITISGISASTARMVLSSLSPSDIQNAILLENVGAFKSIKGIGPKMAQKIVTDLKDKIDKVDETSQLSTFLNNTNQSEALSALIALGFDRNKSRKTISKIIETEGAEMSVEQLIKLALKQL